MKKIEDLNHEEIVQLTREQLHMLIQYECAERGIKIIPEPIAPEIVDVEPNEIVYEFGSLVVKDKEVFNKIRNLFEGLKGKLYSTSYSNSVGYNHKYLKPIEQYELDRYTELKELKVFTRDKFDSVKTQLAEYKTNKDIYDKDIVEYRENEKAKHEETGWIMSTYHAHIKIEQRIETCLTEMQKYVELAEGDLAIAYNFFKKAFDENSWILFQLNKHYEWKLFSCECDNETSENDLVAWEKNTLDAAIQKEIE